MKVQAARLIGALALAGGLFAAGVPVQPALAQTVCADAYEPDSLAQPGSIAAGQTLNRCLFGDPNATYNLDVDYVAFTASSAGVRLEVFNLGSGFGGFAAANVFKRNADGTYTSATSATVSNTNGSTSVVVNEPGAYVVGIEDYWYGGFGGPNYTYSVRLGSASTSTAVVRSLALSPTFVRGEQSSRGTVTLSAAAPVGGAVVALSSSNAAARVPATVTVPAGATSATFTVSTSRVRANQSATITASYNNTRSTATLSITR